MAEKIGRNEPCPCGSGKKYKNCHGDVAATGDTQVRSVQMDYSFDSIILSPETGSDTPRVVINGSLTLDTQHFPFMMIVEITDDARLVIKQMGWKVTPPIVDKDAVAHQLLTYIGRCLNPLSLKAVRSEEKQGGIEWQVLEAGDDTESFHVCIMRPRLGGLPPPDWTTLWNRISLKIEGDPRFSVRGFDQGQIKEAFSQLAQVYSADWIKSAVQKLLGEEATMTTTFSGDDEAAWFPVYQLTRLGSGILCQDSSLSVLVHLGLALSELQAFVDRDALGRVLTEDPSLHHQVCFAADLFQRGRLTSVSDSAPGDLKVNTQEGSLLIHGVEVTQKNLREDLQKCFSNLQSTDPVVVRAVISEAGWYYPEQGLSDSLSGLTLPDMVSAVVIVHRYMAVDGGRVKERSSDTIINPDSEAGLQQQLESIFTNEGEPEQSSCLRVGSYLYLT